MSGKMIYKLLVLLLLLLLLPGCDKDTDDKLEGKWQLREVIDGNNNTMQVDTVYYNFQTSLFMYQIYNRTTDTYAQMYGHKTVKEDNSLFLEIRYYAENLASFMPLTDWDSPERTFSIDKLTGDILILSSESKQYIFSKF